MGPGAEPGFHPGLFLFFVVIGLAQPLAILVGVSAGFLLRRWWLAPLAAVIVVAGLQWLSMPVRGRPLSGDDLMFLLSFSLPAGIWAGVVQAGRAVVRPDGNLL